MKLPKKTGWGLYRLMARNRIRSAAELGRRLEEYGVSLTATHLARLVNRRPERLNMQLLEALLAVLECTPNDLLPLEEDGR